MIDGFTHIPIYRIYLIVPVRAIRDKQSNRFCLRSVLCDAESDLVEGCTQRNLFNLEYLSEIGTELKIFLLVYQGIRWARIMNHPFKLLSPGGNTHLPEGNHVSIDWVDDVDDDDWVDDDDDDDDWVDDDDDDDDDDWVDDDDDDDGSTSTDHFAYIFFTFSLWHMAKNALQWCDSESREWGTVFRSRRPNCCGVVGAGERQKCGASLALQV